MKIYLIRHGRQCDKRCNVDVALSAEGFCQADLAGLRLAGEGIEAVYSSNLIRAYQTAETANRHWNVEHIVEPDLKELCFGDWEGLTDDEISARYAGFQREQEKLLADMRYPGGECAADVAARVMPVLTKIGESGREKVAAVTHGVVIRTLACHILGADLAKWRAVSVTLENGSITEIAYDPEKKRFTLERLNDYAHLERRPELLRRSWGVREN